MSIIVPPDPTRWFKFQYPKDAVFEEEMYFSDTDYSFESQYKDPYLVFDSVGEHITRGTVDEPNHFYSHEDYLSFYSESTLFGFHLPYWFNTVPLYDDAPPHEAITKEDLSYRVKGYEHTLLEMWEVNVQIIFAKRSAEYFKKGELIEFLNFHYEYYGKRSTDLDEWLIYVEDIFKTISDYHPLSYLDYLKMRKQANDWITEKRKELAALEGWPIIVEQPIKTEPTVKSAIEFLIVLYVSGKLGAVTPFIADNKEGCSTNENKEKVETAAQWGMSRWGLEHKVETLQDYTKKSLKDKTQRKKFPKVISFLGYHYPDKVADIKRILAEFEPNEQKDKKDFIPKKSF